MNYLIEVIDQDLLNPKTLIGALVWGLVFMGLGIALAALVRRYARRLEPRLADVTALRFVSALVQVAAYLGAFIVYAHLVPELRAVGTAILAGASVMSVVAGLAAQSTLGNLAAGFSLVLYGTIRVGDNLELNSPKGLITATVESVSLGRTTLLDTEKNEVIVPNSVMVTSVVIRLRETQVSPDATSG